jgi:hypothetical protein
MARFAGNANAKNATRFFAVFGGMPAVVGFMLLVNLNGIAEAKERVPQVAWYSTATRQEPQPVFFLLATHFFEQRSAEVSPPEVPWRSRPRLRAFTVPVRASQTGGGTHGEQSRRRVAMKYAIMRDPFTFLGHRS